MNFDYIDSPLAIDPGHGSLVVLVCFEVENLNDRVEF